MAQFKKGQTVFYASTHFARNDVRASPQKTEMRVISRVVDSCGKKQMTFADRGHDSVFSRTKYVAQYGENKGQFEDVFATADEAFAYLEQHAAERNRLDAERGREPTQFVIYPAVVSDAEWIEATV